MFRGLYQVLCVTKGRHIEPRPMRVKECAKEASKEMLSSRVLQWFTDNTKPVKDVMAATPQAALESAYVSHAWQGGPQRVGVARHQLPRGLLQAPQNAPL